MGFVGAAVVAFSVGGFTEIMGGSVPIAGVVVGVVWGRTTGGSEGVVPTLSVPVGAKE